MAIPASPVSFVTNKSGTRLDINKFPSSLTAQRQGAHIDTTSGGLTGETIWPAPIDTDQHIEIYDMVVSTDTAINIALYQARLADYVTKVTADGAAHLWKLDEASGSAADPIGSRTLTATGTPTYAASSWVCADGQAVSLNGTSQGFKTATKPASSTTGALEAWVWVNTNAGSTKVYLAASDEAGANDYIRANIQTDFLPSFVLRATSGAFLQNATAKYRVPNRSWTHIVWQLHATDGLQCFVNGKSVGLTVSNTGAGWYDDIHSVVDNLTVGYWNSNTNSNWFDGKLACVAWYSAAKSADVWRSHYEMGAPLHGPHYFAANGGAGIGQQTPVKAEAGRPIYLRTSSGAALSIDLYGFEAE